MSIFEDHPGLRSILERAIGAIASCWAIWVLSVALTSHSFVDEDRPEPVLSIEEQREYEARQARREQLDYERRKEAAAEAERREREREQRRLEERRQEFLLQEGWGADPAP